MFMNFLRVALLALPAAVLVACGESDQRTATLAVLDAAVWTGDATTATAVAVDGERIVAVGSAEEISAFIGPETRVIEARGAMLVPGFIDTHVHFFDGGDALASVQLRDAGTPREFTRRIAEFAATLPEGEWITGGAWDHENWGGELPRRDWIDDVTPDNPVWVMRLDGHMALANSAALAAAGVDADTADIDGGEIVRDAEGRPTGVLKDNAMNPVIEAVPAVSEAVRDRAMQAAMNHVAARGVTTVHDMADFASLESYRRLKASDDLITRIYSVVPLSEWERLRDDVAEHGRGDDWLRTGGLKGFMDGSLGSHTAAFLAPFTDAPDDSGFLINSLADMRRWVEGADTAGLQVMVHAIGDRAIRDLFDIYLDVVKANGERDRRFRIEHAQHIHPDDLPRFAIQDVIASMQPYHAIDDGRWADRVIGSERAQTTYAFRSLLESGAEVAFGSDWFVAPPTPLEGIYAAVTRRTLDGAHPDGWVPSQKITVEQALEAYTVTAAYASFEEDNRGRLANGLLADMVLIDRDLRSVPASEIRDAKVLYTIVGGRIVYANPDL